MLPGAWPLQRLLARGLRGRGEPPGALRARFGAAPRRAGSRRGGRAFEPAIEWRRSRGFGVLVPPAGVMAAPASAGPRPARDRRARDAAAGRSSARWGTGSCTRECVDEPEVEASSGRALPASRRGRLDAARAAGARLAPQRRARGGRGRALRPRSRGTRGRAGAERELPRRDRPHRPPAARRAARERRRARGEPEAHRRVGRTSRHARPAVVPRDRRRRRVCPGSRRGGPGRRRARGTRRRLARGRTRSAGQGRGDAAPGAASGGRVDRARALLSARRRAALRGERKASSGLLLEPRHPRELSFRGLARRPRASRSSASWPSDTGSPRSSFRDEDFFADRGRADAIAASLVEAPVRFGWRVALRPDDVLDGGPARLELLRRSGCRKLRVSVPPDVPAARTAAGPDPRGGDAAARGRARRPVRADGERARSRSARASRRWCRWRGSCRRSTTRFETPLRRVVGRCRRSRRRARTRAGSRPGSRAPRRPGPILAPSADSDGRASISPRGSARPGRGLGKHLLRMLALLRIRLGYFGLDFERGAVEASALLRTGRPRAAPSVD